MPQSKPTKAPIIIFGCMFAMSLVSVSIVFVTHSQRTEPYLDTKMRRVRRIERPAVPAPTPAIRSAGDPEAASDGGDADL